MKINIFSHKYGNLNEIPDGTEDPQDLLAIGINLQDRLHTVKIYDIREYLLFFKKFNAAPDTINILEVPAKSSYMNGLASIVIHKLSNVYVYHSADMGDLEALDDDKFEVYSTLIKKSHGVLYKYSDAVDYLLSLNKKVQKVGHIVNVGSLKDDLHIAQVANKILYVPGYQDLLYNNILIQRLRKLTVPQDVYVYLPSPKRAKKWFAKFKLDHNIHIIRRPFETILERMQFMSTCSVVINFNNDNDAYDLSYEAAYLGIPCFCKCENGYTHHGAFKQLEMLPSSITPVKIDYNSDRLMNAIEVFLWGSR